MKTKKKRDWWMPSAVWDDDFSKLSRSPTLRIQNATEDEALGRALLYVQRNIRKLKKGQHFSAGILFPMRAGREKMAKASDMFRIKASFSNRMLLRVRNPRVCFVKGYGPKAHKKVFGY